MDAGESLRPFFCSTLLHNIVTRFGRATFGGYTMYASAEKPTHQSQPEKHDFVKRNRRRCAFDSGSKKIDRRICLFDIFPMCYDFLSLGTDLFGDGFQCCIQAFKTLDIRVSHFSSPPSSKNSLTNIFTSPLINSFFLRRNSMNISSRKKAATMNAPAA